MNRKNFLSLLAAGALAPGWALANRQTTRIVVPFRRWRPHRRHLTRDRRADP